MAHAQQQLLDRLEAVLLAGPTSAGTSVFLDRVDPFQPAELPAASIEEADEGESVEVAMLDGTQRRVLHVTINCVLADTAVAPALARQFGLEVEKAVVLDATLASMARGGRAMTESRLISKGDGNVALACRQQSWQFTYFVNPATPDVFQ